MTKPKTLAWSLQHNTGKDATLEAFTFVTRKDAMKSYEADTGKSYEAARKSGLVKAIRVQVVPA